jgi:hypothetical protein
MGIVPNITVTKIKAVAPTFIVCGTPVELCWCRRSATIQESSTGSRMVPPASHLVLCSYCLWRDTLYFKLASGSLVMHIPGAYPLWCQCIKSLSLGPESEIFNGTEASPPLYNLCNVTCELEHALTKFNQNTHLANQSLEEEGVNISVVFSVPSSGYPGDG